MEQPQCLLGCYATAALRVCTARGLHPGSEPLRRVVLKTPGGGGEMMGGGIPQFTHPLQ